MVRTVIPYNTYKCLFDAYEVALKGIGKREWVAIFDWDTFILDPDWLVKLEFDLKVYDAQLYTAWTNRIGCHWQVDYDSPRGDDLSQHKRYDQLREPKEIYDRTDHQLCGGFFFVFQKRWWDLIRGDIGKWYYKGELVGLDNDIHKATQEHGGKLYQLDLYFYHWYKGGKT